MGMKYTKEIVDFLEKNIEGTSYKEITDKFNTLFHESVTFEAMKGLLQRKGLKNGVNGKFEKGHIPHNKSYKGVCYKGCEKSWFQKGNVPKNYRPIGSERITKDGYIEIKVKDPNEWQLKHRVLWENQHGKIPENHILIFLDGNRLNCSIENLKLVSRSELLILNRRKLLTDDADINNTAAILAKVIDMSNKKQKIQEE